VIDECKYCHGFYGASSMERLPTEVAIKSQILEFKKIKFNNK
jgi:predicted TIM-barrel enzyme